MGGSCSVDGPRSIKEFNHKVATWSKEKTAGPPEERATAQQPVNDDPLHIHADVADLLPREEDDFMVVEIVDASRHSVAAIAKAMRQPSEQAEALERLSEDAMSAQAEGQHASDHRHGPDANRAKTLAVLLDTEAAQKGVPNDIAG